MNVFIALKEPHVLFNVSKLKDAEGILQEQSDLCLHCLPRPICPKTEDHYGILIFWEKKDACDRKGAASK